MGLMENKRGNVGLGLVVGIFCFMAGVLFIQHLGDGVISTRVGMDCTNVDTISDGAKMTCLIVDITVPYFILLLLSIAFGWVGGMLK